MRKIDPKAVKTTTRFTHGFHAAFRELVLHAAALEDLFCPAYCLMLDHLHLIWMGMRRESDQLNAHARSPWQGDSGSMTWCCSVLEVIKKDGHTIAVNPGCANAETIEGGAGASVPGI